MNKWKRKLFFNTAGLILTAPFKFINWCSDGERVYKIRIILMYVVFFILLLVGIFDSHMFSNSTAFWETAFVIVLVMVILKVAGGVIQFGFELLWMFTEPLAEMYDNMRLVRPWYKKSAKESTEKHTYEEWERMNGNDSFHDNYTISREEAIRLFALHEPYTLDELKKKRRILQKFYHPDSGGNEIMSKRINQAFDMLAKGAVKKAAEQHQENTNTQRGKDHENKGEEKNEKITRSLHQ